VKNSFHSEVERKRRRRRRRRRRSKEHVQDLGSEQNALDAL
jgi:hypothetical protein